MPDASYLQSSFLGGEWSPLAQGRMDDQRYRTGLNVCRNGLPIEEGSWTRRPGIRLIAPMRSGQAGVLRQFHFAQSHPYNIELTANHLRLIAGAGLVVESAGAQTVSAVSAANPGVITTGAAHGWASTDQVIFTVDSADIAAGLVDVSVAPLLGRELGIAVVSSTTFSVFDALTGVSIDCTGVTLGTTNLTVNRIADFATNYVAADLSAINSVQGQTQSQGNFMMLLHNGYQPGALTSTSIEQGGTLAAFSWNAAVAFTDGPYFDPPSVLGIADGSTITPSGTSGSVTLTLTQGSTLPTFKPTDIGRSVRLFSEPAAWNIATAYIVGDQVKYQGAYYQALKAQTGKQPDVDVVNWAVSTNAAVWVWATITAWTDATHVTATLKPVVANGVTGPNLPRTTACIFRLGVYSDTTGYPACGLYHEGRLWLAGAQANRFDASVSNSAFDFTPTSYDGTVADNNGISGVFNSSTTNPIFWMVADERGVVAGTQGGEWLISASQTNDPITPTSIQAHQKTTYGSANIPAYRAGLAIVFVQRYNKKLLEYITTDFRGLTAKNISEAGKHLTAKDGLAEIAYVREKTPTIWARTRAGVLLGCAYRRESAYASDPPDFAGWHRHDLGNGMTVASIQTGPNFDGNLDALSMVLTDGSQYFSALMTDQFDTDWQIGDANYVDFSVTPRLWKLLPNNSAPTSIRLYSLHRLAGKNVDVFLAGIDFGQLAVAADGHLDIPINGLSGASLLATTAYLTALTSTNNFHGLGMGFLQVAPSATVPVLTGIAQFYYSNLGSQQSSATVLDWDHNRMNFCGYTGVGATGTKGIYSIDLTTRQQVALVQDPALNFSSVISSLDRFGGLITYTSATNQGAGHKFDKSFKHIWDFGAAGIGFASDATHLQFPTSQASPIQTGRVDWAILSSLVINEITFFNITDGAWCGTNFTADEGRRAVLCVGRKLTNLGEAFGLAAGTQGDAGPTRTVGAYRFVVSPSGAAFKQTIPKMTNPALLYPGTGPTGNPAWTHVNSCGAVIYDATDGNLIGMFNSTAISAWNAGVTYAVGDWVSSGGHDFTSKVAGNLNHLPTVGGDANWNDIGVHSVTGICTSKINARTGAVMWTIQDYQPISDSTINYSRITGGVMMAIVDHQPVGGSTKDVVAIDTIAGTLTVKTTVANTQIGQQWYNDVTGQLIFTITPNGKFDPLVPLFGMPVAGTTVSGYFTLGPATGTFYPASTAPSGGVTWTVPAAIGYSYTSQGQILRPIHPQEAGAANGPALGKTRRSHQLAALLAQTQGISFGTDFTKVHGAELKTKGGNNYALTTLYSGVQWGNIEDDYSFDSMVCWQVTRPYPATVCALGPFLHTQDR